MLSNYSLINLSPKKIFQIFGKFEVWQAPDAVNKIFLLWDKPTLLVLINEYKKVRGNLEVPFLSWVLFTNVFSHEKTVYNSVKNVSELVRNWPGNKSLKITFTDQRWQLQEIWWHLWFAHLWQKRYSTEDC